MRSSTFSVDSATYEAKYTVQTETGPKRRTLYA